MPKTNAMAAGVLGASGQPRLKDKKKSKCRRCLGWGSGNDAAEDVMNY